MADVQSNDEDLVQTISSIKETRPNTLFPVIYLELRDGRTKAVYPKQLAEGIADIIEFDQKIDDRVNISDNDIKELTGNFKNWLDNLPDV